MARHRWFSLIASTLMMLMVVVAIAGLSLVDALSVTTAPSAAATSNGLVAASAAEKSSSSHAHDAASSMGSTAPDHVQLKPEQHTLHDEREASGGDLTVSFHYWIMTLGLTVVVLSHDVVHRLHLTSRLSESGAIILLGIFFGWLVMEADSALGDPKDSLLDAIKFDHSFFVRFVLPVIIFEQGYGMNHGGVLENLEVVLLLAIPGVVVSGVLIGVFLYMVSPVVYPAVFETSGGFFLCFALGALLSATDPVAIVSILRSKFDITQRPPTIYNVIFGESMLNDAVSIVLFEVALDYVNLPVTLGSIVHASWHFVCVLVGSALCGYLHGVIGVVVLRLVMFHTSPHLEVLLNVLFAVASYYLCEFLDFSGIMSLFVAARMLGHYGPKHMSAEARQHAPVIFRTLSSLAESASFFLLGTAFFAYPHTWGLGFALSVVFACLMSRAVVVAMCTRISNLRRVSPPLPLASQTFIWYSGIRGAVSFGLVAVLVDHCGLIGVPDDVATLMLSSTLMVIAFTVLVLGGFATSVLEFLKLDHEAPSPHLPTTPSSSPSVGVSFPSGLHAEDDNGAARSSLPHPPLGEGCSSSLQSASFRALAWLRAACRVVADMHQLIVGPLLDQSGR